MARVVLIRGWEANNAIGRVVLQPHVTYPITWMRYEGPPGRMRCQIMDRFNGNRAIFAILTLDRLRRLPEAEYLLGDAEGY